MNFILGLVVTVGCMLGGFAALGGHLVVLWQPWEFVIIMGSALGTFIVANPTKVILDTGKALTQAVLGKAPKRRDYLDILGLLHSLLREIRSKARNEVEVHIDAPSESPIFNAYPRGCYAPCIRKSAARLSMRHAKATTWKPASVSA